MAMFTRHHFLTLLAVALVQAVTIPVASAQEPPRWSPSRARASRADFREDFAPQDNYGRDAYYDGPVSPRTGRPPRQYLQSRAGTIATTSAIEGPSFSNDQYGPSFDPREYEMSQRQPSYDQGYRQPRYRSAPYGRPQYEMAQRPSRTQPTNWQPEPEPEFSGPGSRNDHSANYDYQVAQVPGGPYVPPPAYNPGMTGPSTGLYYPGGPNTPYAYTGDPRGHDGYGGYGYDHGVGGYGSDGYGYGDGYGGNCGGDCYGGNCGPCGDCGYGDPCSGPWYARGEYLLWWLSGDSLPPMVTTSPTGTAPTQAGVLGQPGTTLLYGNNTVNTQSRSGVRVTIGKWLSPVTRIEGEWFSLGNVNSGFDASSTGTPIIARPFLNLQTGNQASNLIAYPNRASGSININDMSNFLGASIGATRNMLYGCGYGCESYRVDFLYGFRYLGLYESLSADSRLTTGPASPFPAGSVFASSDYFSTSNSFFGGNLGMATEAMSGRWYFSGIGRLGIGGTLEKVAINGSSTAISPAGAVTHSAGGFFAQPTNIGNYSRGAFALVPHLELKIGYDFTSAFRWTFGYDVMYWSRVVRPGDQLDIAINPTQQGGGALAGTPGPTFRFVETDLWVQGVSTGLEYRW